MPDLETWPLAQKFLDILRSQNWRMNAALDLFEDPCPLNSCRAVKSWLLNPILRGGIGYHNSKKTHVFAEVAWDLHEPLISHSEFRQMMIKMEENGNQWGRNVQNTPQLLTGLCWCPNCGKRMKYAGRSRSIKSVLCTTRGCISRYKTTRESVIVEALNKTLAAKAQQLGQHISDEPAEAAPIRDQINRLQKLNDPDLDEVIAAKQQKLRNLLATASPMDQARVAALSDVKAWEMATEEELRMIYLEFVSKIEADRGEVVSIHLKL